MDHLGAIVAAFVGFFLGWLFCSMMVIRTRSEHLAQGAGRTREIGSYEAMECRRRAEARDAAIHEGEVSPLVDEMLRKDGRWNP